MFIRVLYIYVCEVNVMSETSTAGVRGSPSGSSVPSIIGRSLIDYFKVNGGDAKEIYTTAHNHELNYSSVSIDSPYFLFERDLSQTTRPMLTWREVVKIKNLRKETKAAMWAFYDYVVVQSDVFENGEPVDKFVEIIFLPSNLKPGYEKVEEFIASQYCEWRHGEWKKYEDAWQTVITLTKKFYDEISGASKDPQELDGYIDDMIRELKRAGYCEDE